jgi:hypothetical protein
MIRQSSELSAQCHTEPTPSSKRSAASTANKRNSTATDEYDFEMELDEQLGVHNPPPSWDNKDDDDDLEDEEDMEDKQAKRDKVTAETLVYGGELSTEFANDPRREVQQALRDTFALIAYPDARESSLAPLLEVAGRVPVAEELNSAILGTSNLVATTSQHTARHSRHRSHAINPLKVGANINPTVSLGKSSSAALELLIQQTEALVAELAQDGGPGAFINVKRDFLQ